MNSITHLAPCLSELDSLGDPTTQRCPSCLTFFLSCQTATSKDRKPHINFRYFRNVKPVTLAPFGVPRTAFRWQVPSLCCTWSSTERHQMEGDDTA